MHTRPIQGEHLHEPVVQAVCEIAVREEDEMAFGLVEVMCLSQ